MLITMVFCVIWFLLMLRSVVAEYNYYQSVKTLEPELWEKLGAPTYLKVPFVFLSTKGIQILQESANKTVVDLKRKHRSARIHFLSYVILVIVMSILYFKSATF